MFSGNDLCAIFGSEPTPVECLFVDEGCMLYFGLSYLAGDFIWHVEPTEPLPGIAMYSVMHMKDRLFVAYPVLQGLIWTVAA